MVKASGPSLNMTFIISKKHILKEINPNTAVKGNHVSPLEIDNKFQYENLFLILESGLINVKLLIIVLVGLSALDLLSLTGGS